MSDGVKREEESPFGTGHYKSLSGRLLKYINNHKERIERLKQQYGSSVL